MSIARLGIVSQTIIVVGIVGYDALDLQLMQSTRHRSRAMIHDVLSRDKERSRFHADDFQDGFVLVCEGKSPVTCLNAVCRDLADLLRQDRKAASPQARLRLRIAVNYGMVAPDDFPWFGMSKTAWFGAPITHALRMLHAKAVDRALDTNPDTDLVVIASNQVHNDVIVPGFGPDPADFREVAVACGKADDTAWLYLPGGNDAHKSVAQRQRWKPVMTATALAVALVAAGITQKWRLEVPERTEARLQLPVVGDVTGTTPAVPTPAPVWSPAPVVSPSSEPKQQAVLSAVERARERCPDESGESPVNDEPGEPSVKGPRGVPSRVETC